ncbi:MAG: Na+/H+-dicarboxylate symporter [Flammeovirgaceae bacterium]|jgi:Na+/H+-dicarboxylate symporter
MKNLALHWKILIGLVLGIAWAFISSALGWNKFTVDWINPWGTIFINLLKMIAVPLVLFSIIKGITDLSDSTKLGRMGAKTLITYLLTTITAVSLGLLLVNVFQPGKGIEEAQRIENRLSYEIWVSQTEGVEILDNQSYLTNPEYASYVESATKKVEEGGENEFVKKSMDSAKSTKDAGPLNFLVDIIPSNVFSSFADNSLMLQIIFFGLFFGVTMILLPREKIEPIAHVVEAANEIFLKMVDLVMAAAPFFVFCLLAGKLAEMAGDDPNAIVEILFSLLKYCLVVVLGLGTMIFLFYPVLMALLTSRKTSLSFGQAYVHFFKSMSPAQLMAFSTSSSVATLPVTMECVNEKLGVSEEVSSFVLPIGATVNMDGTSLYQAIAVVFLAQLHSVDLTFGQQMTIVLTATLASIGSAAVPSAGLIMLIIVLQSVGLNPAWIAIIFPVDRILDMCRTVVNVTGDATVSSIIAASEGELHVEANAKG